MYLVWAILLLVLGAGLALLEVFFTSAGILAVLSVAALSAAVALGFYQGVLPGTIILLSILIGLPVLIVLAFKYWPKTSMGKRVLLMAPTSEEVLPDDPQKHWLKGLIGRTGRTKSKLLLSGVITIDGRTVEAVSESMPIEVGQAVQVVQVRGLRVVVRPAEDGSSAAPPPDPLQRAYDDPFELPRLDSRGRRGDVNA